MAAFREYPLSSVPSEWYEHLKRERVCLVITGRDLALVTDAMEGIDAAVRRGDAFSGMVFANDGSV